MKWTGRLERLDLGTGGWALQTKGFAHAAPGGERILLFGPVPDHLAGDIVVVHGHELEDGASFAMTGDKMVQVHRVEKADASVRSP